MYKRDVASITDRMLVRQRGKRSGMGWGGRRGRDVLGQVPGLALFFPNHLQLTIS